MRYSLKQKGYKYLFSSLVFDATKAVAKVFRSVLIEKKLNITKTKDLRYKIILIVI